MLKIILQFLSGVGSELQTPFHGRLAPLGASLKEKLDRTCTQNCNQLVPACSHLQATSTFLEKLFPQAVESQIKNAQAGDRSTSQLVL